MDRGANQFSGFLLVVVHVLCSFLFFFTPHSLLLSSLIGPTLLFVHSTLNHNGTVPSPTTQLTQAHDGAPWLISEDADAGVGLHSIEHLPTELRTK